MKLKLCQSELYCTGLASYSYREVLCSEVYPKSGQYHLPSYHRSSCYKLHASALALAWRHHVCYCNAHTHSLMSFIQLSGNGHLY